MTYLHVIFEMVRWGGLVLSCVVLMALLGFMLLGLTVMNDREERKAVGLLWVIGFPVLFFATPAWLLWANTF